MNNISPKTNAVIAYLTFIGLLIAILLNKEKKDTFVLWHIKNMFGLVVLLFVAVALQNYAVGFYFYWATVVLWFFSLVMALLGKKKAIPLVSEKFQQWFMFLG
ncbi:MAG: hypothetical protein KDC91_02680 [Flavobacteriaceae bacterium]|nr:hypothetical protein [Flavobacteriaceae bacterium]